MSIADHPGLGETASAIPTGTVTFLFTDIEGSTRLLERLRQEYADLLAEQRRLLRAAFAEWNGFEVDTQGDSFFVAFPRAVDALQCTVEAQRAIAAHTWPQGVQLRVRMALHTGEPLVQRTGYVGMDVHRAARIGSAAHGGQVLVSGSTRELVTADMPTGMDLIALGKLPTEGRSPASRAVPGSRRRPALGLPGTAHREHRRRATDSRRRTLQGP